MTSEAKDLTIEGRRVTWGYTRKTSPAQYESEEVSLFVSDAVPSDVEDIGQWVTENTEQAYATLKAEVWAALGLSFSFDGRGFPKLDRPAPKRPIDADPPAPQPPPAPANQPAPPANQPAQGMAPVPGGAQVGTYAAFPGFCKECGAQGIESFYDNRADVDGRIAKGLKIGPDFKCKQCKNGLFRPGSYEYNEAIKSGARNTATPPPPPVG